MLRKGPGCCLGLRAFPSHAQARRSGGRSRRAHLSGGLESWVVHGAQHRPEGVTFLRGSIPRTGSQRCCFKTRWAQDRLELQLEGQLPCAVLPLKHGLDFEVQLGDELELAVAQLRAGEVSLMRLEGEAETEAECEAAGPVYQREELLAARAASEGCGKLPILQQSSEAELLELLEGAVLAGLPPAWWHRRPVDTKRQVLATALRAGNMPAVYAMQPESLQFREAIACYEPDGEFLANVLAQLWADSAEPTKAWKSPAAKEAVEWLLLRGAPCALLLPEEPEALKTRLRALRMLGELGPRVASVAAASVAGCLRDPEAKGRMAACKALEQLGEACAAAPRAVPRLARLLHDSECCMMAADALRAMGASGCRAAAEAMREEEDHMIRSACCHVLAAGGRPYRAELLQVLQDEGAPGFLRAAAAKAMGQQEIDRELCVYLVDLLESEDPTLRLAAVGLLGDARGELAKMAFEALASALDDPVEFVSEAATRALNSVTDA
ncbi:unnamed protein product [Effrenium voratum]|nr:unnamed protein product [Effrenium voratum]